MADNEAKKSQKIQQMTVKARARTNIFQESEFGNKFLHQDTDNPDNQKFVGPT